MRRRVISGIVQAMVAICLLIVVGAPGSAPARAEALDWELTGLTGDMYWLAGPTSGALFARRYEDAPPPAPNTTSTRTREQAIWRSDDAGQSWRKIDLPPDLAGIVADPTDHTIFYAYHVRGEITLYKSVDTGETWAPAVAESEANPLKGGKDLELVVSQADHNLLYLAYRSGNTSMEIMRSHDGGQTWTKARSDYGASPGCFVVVKAFQPHPIDPNRILRIASCTLYFSDLNTLGISDDQARTWTPHGGPSVSGYISGIVSLVGWDGVKPERMYALMSHSQTTGQGRSTETVGYSLFRSDDEGQTWTLLRTNLPGERHDSTFIRDPGNNWLAYDRSRPDVVFHRSFHGVQMSTDAGATWADLGRQDLPQISELLVGIDGRYLFAATKDGVYRIAIPQ
jgi:photosystem II stability/assembly factor-like uncharacterized protein